MAPIYEAVCSEQGWEVDQAQLARMSEANAKRLQELDEKIADAGASGVLACMCACARACGQCLSAWVGGGLVRLPMGKKREGPGKETRQ